MADVSFATYPIVAATADILAQEGALTRDMVCCPAHSVASHHGASCCHGTPPSAVVCATERGRTVTHGDERRDIGDR